MPAHLQALLTYSAGLLAVVGLIFAARYALRARQEAREGVTLVSEADVLSEFQRARDAGEMDDAEFRRVRDLLIHGKRPEAAGGPPDASIPGTPPPPALPETRPDLDPQ